MVWPADAGLEAELCEGDRGVGGEYVGDRLVVDVEGTRPLRVEVEGPDRLAVATGQRHGENAADADAYLARMQSYAKQLEGELGRIKAARAKGVVPPALLIDKGWSKIRAASTTGRSGSALVEARTPRAQASHGSGAGRARGGE